MIIDVQINAMEDTVIAVNDKTGDGDRLIGVEFGLGTAQILLTLQNAAILQKKLEEEIMRQRAEMVGEGAIRFLAKRDWVKRILVKPVAGEVLLFVQSDLDIDLAFNREVLTIGNLIGRAAEVTVVANLTPVNQNLGDGFVEVYENIQYDFAIGAGQQSEKEVPKETPAPAEHC